MRRLFNMGWVVVGAVWAVCSAAWAAPMGFDEAKHLLARTSFGASAPVIESFARLTRAEAVERLLSWTGKPRMTPPPPWVNEPVIAPQRLRDMTVEERQVFQRTNTERGLEMRGWWLQEMVATPSPLTEKMVLFWHNHFVSSQQKVRQPQYLYRQNLLLREHALGNFGAFLHAIARDPAMVIYLDSASNRKGQPNENFAREVMELFTLGEGHYTEHDVKEAARAFTGWSIDPASGAFQFRSGAHDNGFKTVLGNSGNLDGDTVLNILLARPQTAEFIVSKLWREFVSPMPDAAEVRRIASVFRDSGYNIREALRALLMSDAFYAPSNRAVLVKSPVDLVVGTLRQFQFSVGDAPPFALVVAQLGQNLFSPPNVKGWPGGEAWITSTTLLGRKQFLERLFAAQDRRPAMMAQAMASTARAPVARMQQRLQRSLAEAHFDAERWTRESGHAPERVVLATAPQLALPGGTDGIEIVRRLTQDPAYQLK